MRQTKISFFVGLLITVTFSYFTYTYLNFHNQNEFQRHPQAFFEALEALDLRYNDLKYKVRNERTSSAPVVLVAIDDDSIRDLGRWPWSRDIMTSLTQKILDLGAKTVTFDVIFSEPEKASPQNDQQLTELVAKNKEQIILGTFSENLSRHESYQDYCVSEAFLRTGGADLVKLNPTFVVEDTSTAIFEELPWSDLFDIFFSQIQSQTRSLILKEFKKTSESQLSTIQRNSLHSELNKSLYNYCRNWLTPQDPLLFASDRKQIENFYKQFYDKAKELRPLNLTNFIAKLKNDSLPHPVPQYIEWTANIPSLQQSADYTASFVAKLDPDGYVRRYPLFYRSGNKLGSSFIPSLAMQAYLLAKGYRAEVKIDKDPKYQAKSITQFTIIDTNQNPEAKVLELPIDAAGQLLLNYNGPQMALPYVSAKELFSEKEHIEVKQRRRDEQRHLFGVQSQFVNPLTYFKDRNVIIGATAMAVYDLRNTPTEPNYPGPEIHLTALANLLDQDFLKQWDNETQFLPLLMLFLGLLLSLAFATLGSALSLILALCTFSIATFADFWIFTHYQYRTSGLFLTLLILFIYFAITVFRFFTEEKLKRELKSTFAKYVSPAIVDELLKEPKNLKLGGRRQRMSVFFSDLRGFTTISEKLPPEELSRILNLYLSPMTEIVFANKGTLDKYMGDAIMAFFGAPLPSENHAVQACRCALQSLEKLKDLQSQFASEGLPHLDIGIGINTGDMSVGNMGSNIVQNYTVMGDAVNLASRLEGINKEYGSKIIISEFTYKDVKDVFTAREIDRVRVKGKQEPVKIFELLKEGPATGNLQQKLQTFADAYQLYLQKNFQAALTLFENNLKSEGGDPISEVYVKRCQEFLKDAPPEDWDGVYVMKTK